MSRYTFIAHKYTILSRDASTNFRTLGTPYSPYPVLGKISVPVLKFVLQKYGALGTPYSPCQVLVKMAVTDAQIRSP